MHIRRLAGICSLIAGISLAGCSGSAANKGARVEVKGTVRFQSQPLREGFISFSPLEGQDTQAQVLVTDGAYRIDRNSGLKPGRYLVRLSAGDGTTPHNSAAPAGPPGPGGRANILSRELIPAEWNLQSTQERLVTPANPNTFDLVIP